MSCTDLGFFHTYTFRWNVTINFSIVYLASAAVGYWDMGSTTEGYIRTDLRPRQSFFRWQQVQASAGFWSTYRDADLYARRASHCTVGLSIDMIPLGTGVMLNRRVILSAANLLERWMSRSMDLRVWTLGNYEFNTPFRYRVLDVKRVFPRSYRPEHQHGTDGQHSPRHDLTVIITLDQMYIFKFVTESGYALPYKALLAHKMDTLTDLLIFTGSGFEYMTHIRENYKIFYGFVYYDMVVNCEEFIPKWWGKFICFRNFHDTPGISNGGPLLVRDDHMSAECVVIGIASFEIRYNEDRIYVFTDLRYYYDLIVHLANFTRGDYYEYAYPEWSIVFNPAASWMDSTGDAIPQVKYPERDYPLGRK